MIAGTREPWQVLPYEIHRPTDEVFSTDCPRLSAAAYDPARQLIYVTESEAGPFGETVVHVWALAPGLFADGFETGNTSFWGPP